MERATTVHGSGVSRGHNVTNGRKPLIRFMRPERDTDCTTAYEYSVDIPDSLSLARCVACMCGSRLALVE